MNDDGRGVGDLGGALLADGQLPETKHFLDSNRLDIKAKVSNPYPVGIEYMKRLPT